MITIWLEGLALRIQTDAIYPLIMSKLPRVITSPDGLSPGEQAMRAIAKPAIRSLLFVMRRELAAAGVPAELHPRPPKGEDVVMYGVRWMLANALDAIEGTDWDAKFEEHADGLHLTSLAPVVVAGAGTAAPQSLDASAVESGPARADAQAGDATDHAAALRLAR